MKKLKKLIITALFTAIIFIATFFIKFPAASGYVHLGDSLIYLCALIIGSPYGALAGALGEGLADLSGGYAVYAPATIIIKAALAFVFMLAPRKRFLSIRSFAASFFAGLITVGGYFIADLVIDRAYAFADIPGNVIQAVGSMAIFAILALALDAAKVKNRLRL